MKKFSKLILFICLLFMAACQRIESIAYEPKISPENFLQNQPWVKISLGNLSFIWSQPSSSIIVYFVGFFTMYAGYVFLKKKDKQASTGWWGLGLLLTGFGALLAGTSYQALGYEIKCSGRAFCTFTSTWEIVYMLVSVPGMNAFLVATAYTNVKASFRKAIMLYAIFNTLGYFVLMLWGVLYASKWAVSFECMSLVSAPSLIFFLILHGINYFKNRDTKNVVLLKTWLLFLAVGISYGLYLGLGISSALWQKGIWFTENDVLHVGMICWVYYILKKSSQVISDID